MARRTFVEDDALGGEANSKPRLNSWKEVAAFFGRTERTVMRWEIERGLPIHRVPGDSRSRIYAEADELTAWLRGGSNPDLDTAPDIPAPSKTEPASEDTAPADPPVPAEPEPPRRWRRLAITAGICLTLGAAAILSHDFWRPQHKPPAAAEVLYLKGIQDWSQRTPDSLGRAVNDFNQARLIDPQYAQAYAGLAITYDLLREYTAMPAAQAFETARDNAERAIRLDDRLGIAHASLAFALYHGYGDAKGATFEFGRALALEPDNPTIQHWYATFLLSRTDFAGALTHINRALELNPSSRAIKADRAIIMARAGQVDAAIALLDQLAKAEPDFRSPHSYLAQIYFELKPNDEAYLRETLKSVQLNGDLYGESLARSAAAGYQQGGHQGFLRALLAAHLEQFRKGVGTAIAIAEIYARLGDDANAVAYLKTAVDRNEEDAKYYRQWLDYARLKTKPAFQAQIKRLPQSL